MVILNVYLSFVVFRKHFELLLMFQYFSRAWFTLKPEDKLFDFDEYVYYQYLILCTSEKVLLFWVIAFFLCVNKKICLIQRFGNRCEISRLLNLLKRKLFYVFRPFFFVRLCTNFFPCAWRLKNPIVLHIINKFGTFCFLLYLFQVKIITLWIN